MDEIRKIPPITRFLVGSTGLVTLPCILQITTPYVFVLHWPFVLRKLEIWRPLTAFFYGGTGLSLLFNVFMLFRNSSDLEENRFFRRTSKYAWALIVMGTMILGLNYPLRSPIVFSPMLNALIYIWANANPNSNMNFFGVVSIPAKWVPYVYLGMDLLQGGYPVMIQSATGLLAAYAYTKIDEVNEQAGGRRTWASFLINPPVFLQRLMPDSVDPALGPGPTPTGGAGRSTAFGSAYAPRGRSFGETRGGQTLGSPSSSTGGGSAAGGIWSSLTSFGRGGSSGRTQAPPSREDILAAAERRLRSQADNSIIGRHNAGASSSRTSSSQAPTASAGGPSLQTESRSSALSNNPSEAVRRTAAAGAPSSNTFSFGQLAARDEKAKDPNMQEDASGSGGRVAEQRREKPAPSSSSAANNASGSGTSQWPGSGRKLGE